jgi:hypothetical protein
MSSAPRLYQQAGGSGYFRIWAKSPSGVSTEITFVRDVPTIIDSMSTADPFSDSSASLSFSAVTGFDRPGNGMLSWLVPYSQITIRWYDMTEVVVNGVSTTVPVVNPNWVWEGYIASEEIGQPYQVQCKGALFQADNFLAEPLYPTYPIPYETMISKMLDPVSRPTIGTSKLVVEYPSDWATKVPTFKEPSYLWFLVPQGLATGANWSGLTTRDTGSWNPIMTGYIQNLLATMYTPTGEQWTLMKRVGRVPVLMVRNRVIFPDSQTLVVYYEAPGTKSSFSRDFTQTANVIYGDGKDLAGSTFTGMQIAADQTTWYEPYSALPQVYPANASNPRWLKTMPVKEMHFSFQQGMDELTAKDTAYAQLQKFADPGYTGSITIQSDPMRDGQPFNKFLIQAGQSVLLKNFRGGDVLFHIAAVTVSPEENSVSLTVDNKYRDALTVGEVRARTRDALDPINLLKPGSVSGVVNDMLKPWSYANGSGVIPSGGNNDATPFFKSMPATSVFPWTDWTAKYPPKKFPQYYIKVSRKSASASDRWQDYWGTYKVRPKFAVSVPIKGAEAGTIRLTQIAAYDRDGKQVPCRFHFAIYDNNGVTVQAMPMIPAGVKGLPTGYAAGQYYPFFPAAFNNYKPSGELTTQGGVLLSSGSTMFAGWGTSEEPAGYSPGTKGTGSAVTGRLEDAASWSFDTATNDKNFDKSSAQNVAGYKTAGYMYCMLFQDDLPEAYFIGRLWKDPATAPTGGGG